MALLFRFKKKKLLNRMAFLLLPFMFISFFGGSFALYSKNISQSDQPVSVQTRSISPCQQQKNAQNTALKLCQQLKLQYCLILSDFINFFRSQSGRIAFLYIIGLIAMSPISRIFKPPRFQFIG